MLVYICGLGCSCLLSWICSEAKIEEKSNSYCMISAIISSFPLILISAIRYNVGMDYRAYARGFRQMEAGAKLDTEWLFFLLNKGIALICKDYAALFLVTAVLCMTFVFLQIFRDSPSPALSAFFFVTAGYYFISMNAVRQMIGCAILLCSLHSVFEKKFLRFIFLVFIAGGFHKSCLLFVVVFFINLLRVKKELILIATIFIYMFSNTIGNIVNGIVVETEYSEYLGSVFDTGKQGRVTLIINIAILVFSYLFFERKNEKYYLYYSIQAIAVWMSILTGKVVLINRLGFMFGLPVIILLPMALEAINSKWLRSVGTAFIVSLYSLYLLYTVGLYNSNHVLPFTTIFSRIAGY